MQMDAQQSGPPSLQGIMCMNERRRGGTGKPHEFRFSGHLTHQPCITGWLANQTAIKHTLRALGSHAAFRAPSCLKSSQFGRAQSGRTSCILVHSLGMLDIQGGWFIPQATINHFLVDGSLLIESWKRHLLCMLSSLLT